MHRTGASGLLRQAGADSLRRIRAGGGQGERGRRRRTGPHDASRPWPRCDLENSDDSDGAANECRRQDDEERTPTWARRAAAMPWNGE